MKIWRRLRYLVPSYRRRQERELQEELESLRGMAEPRELGNLTIVAENARSVWGWNWFDNVGQDFRYALRTLVRHKRITAVALLSLALGIGANALVFTFLNSLAFHPIPFPEPERLVRLGFNQPNNPGRFAGPTRRECALFRDMKAVFAEFGCWSDGGNASLSDATGGSSKRLNGMPLTAGAARAIGMPPLLGRWFSDDEEAESAAPVLLISFDLWQRRFGGKPDVLGTVVRLDGEPAAIIGVMPENFVFVVPNADYWVPLRTTAVEMKSVSRILGSIGRLRGETALQVAQAQLDPVAARLAQESPESNKGWGIVLRKLEREDVDVLADSGDSLMVLQGAVAFVLMIACANVAGLLLAQATTQHKELAVRTALGSNRWRLFRQLLVHSILLSATGGMLGLVLGWWGVRVLIASLPAGLPRRIYETHLDLTVVLATVAVAFVSALIVGIVPAFHASHADPMDAMRDAGRSSGLGRQRLRSVFVAGQIALAFVLLAGAGLMVNSLIRTSNVSLGFEPKDLVTVAVQLPEGKFRRPTSAVLQSGALEMRIDPRIYLTSEEIRRRLAAIPGVSSASAIAINPPLSGVINMPVRVEGRPAAPAHFLPVMADYFRTLQVKVVQGREFVADDKPGSPFVAVINETMAKQYWPNESAIGRRIRIESALLPNQPEREVVGVVTEIMQYVGQEPRPQLYIPFSQVTPEHDERLSNDLRRLTFVLRTALPVAAVVPAATAAVTQADSGQAISQVQTMYDTVFHSLERRRVYVGLLGTFAAVAVLLAVVGVYGVMAQAVSQRTNEIGLRIALGAHPRQVRSLILRRGGRLIAVGLLIGAAGALALTRVLRNVLFGVTPADPLTYIAGMVVLGGIALIACYLPARRASRVDPLTALRHD